MASPKTSLLDHGFAVLPGVLPHPLIDAHLDRVEPVIHLAMEDVRREEGGPAGEIDASVYFRNARRVLRRGIEACRESEATQALFYNEDVRSFAQDCFGAEPVFSHGSTTLYPTGRAPDVPQPPHADYLSSAAPDPWTMGLRFWCALEDIDPDSGPLEIWPRSHTEVSPRVQTALVDEDPEIAAGLVRQLDAASEAGWKSVVGPLLSRAGERLAVECEKLGLKSRTFALRKGDVVAFNPGVVHRPSPARDRRLTRKVLIFNLCHPTAPWYSFRAYWGARHDYRCPDNQMPDIVERGPHGLRWANYPAAWEAKTNLPVVRP